MCSQCRSPEHTGHTFKYSSSRKGDGISTVKSVAYAAVQTATNCKLQTVQFGQLQNNCFCLSLFMVAERTIKLQLYFVFILVLVLVLHLNVLAKHNKWNLWQVNKSFIAPFIPAYFEESGPSDKYQVTERCCKTDSQTAHISHQWIILHIL
jgi:hypothetical protein